MQIGDKVKHIHKGWIGVIYSIEKYGYLIDWSNHLGIRFRMASIKDLGGYCVNGI